MGTHDPKMFIKRREMERILTERGFQVWPIVGLGLTDQPTPDLTLGSPFTGIMYMGHATRTDA